METPELDELTFEPTDWDLAMSIWLMVDEDSDRAALDELADAMLVWAKEETLDELTKDALAHLWEEELEEAIREGLTRASADPEWSRAASRACQALDEHGEDSEIAHETVRHLAMQLGQEDQPFFACLCCIDDGLETVEPSAKREQARRAAVLARRNADISDSELHAAISQLGATDPADALGTPERREAVRRRLARLGRLGASSMPALAAELTRIGAEPLPAAASDDDVWIELCTWMLADAATPDLN
jgi:hypothetical protein